MTLSQCLLFNRASLFNQSIDQSINHRGRIWCGTSVFQCLQGFDGLTYQLLIMILNFWLKLNVLVHRFSAFSLSRPTEIPSRAYRFTSTGFSRSSRTESTSSGPRRVTRGRIWWTNVYCGTSACSRKLCLKRTRTWCSLRYKCIPHKYVKVYMAECEVNVTRVTFDEPSKT